MKDPRFQRKYFYGVLGAIAPGYLEAALNTAIRKRNIKEPN
jgi:hypothetical protein